MSTNKTFVIIDLNLDNDNALKIRTYKICSEKCNKEYIYYYSYNSNHSTYRCKKSKITMVQKKAVHHYVIGLISDKTIYTDIIKADEVQNALNRITKAAEEELSSYCSSLNYVKRIKEKKYDKNVPR